jgi:hypothetical protein
MLIAAAQGEVRRNPAVASVQPSSTDGPRKIAAPRQNPMAAESRIIFFASSAVSIRIDQKVGRLATSVGCPQRWQSQRFESANSSTTTVDVLWQFGHSEPSPVLGVVAMAGDYSQAHVVGCFENLGHQTIATISTTPSTSQTIAFPRCPANQKPLAALKQRTALVHPLVHAAGLLSIFKIFIKLSFQNRPLPKPTTRPNRPPHGIRWEDCPQQPLTLSNGVTKC